MKGFKVTLIDDSVKYIKSLEDIPYGCEDIIDTIERVDSIPEEE